MFTKANTTKKLNHSSLDDADIDDGLTISGSIHNTSYFETESQLAMSSLLGSSSNKDLQDVKLLKKSIKVTAEKIKNPEISRLSDVNDRGCILC